jgi:hypothetical protein
VLVGGSNITLSQSTSGASGTLTIVGPDTGSIAAINGIAAGTQTATIGTVVLSNSNGISFGMAGSTCITATYTVPSTAGLISAVNISAGTTSNNLTGLVFNNSNGLSFGLSASTITGSYSVPTVTNSSLTLSDAATSLTIGQLAFTNSNGLTLSLSTTTGGKATVVGSYTVPTVPVVTNSSWTVSDAATSMTMAQLAFTNTNGMTLSLSTTTGGKATVVGSYTVPSVTNSSLTISDALTSMSLAQLAFTNSNGLTLSLSTTTGGKATVIGSYTVPTVPPVTNSSWTLSDANTSITIARLAFTNSNGLTLSLSTTTGGSATLLGSYTVPSVTNSSLTLSDANTSITAARLAFTNSNGLTLSLSTAAGGSATVIGSYTVPSVTNSSWTVSDANTSISVARLAFTNSNGLTLSLSTTTGGSATLIGSYTVPSVPPVTNSSFTLSDVNTSITAARLAFTNSNGLTLSLSTTTGGSATVVGSYTVPTVTNSSMTLSDANTSTTIARLAFTNSNGLTLSLSTAAGGSATLLGSYTVPTVTNSSLTLSDANTSTTVARLAFTNSNGLTLSLSTAAGGSATVIGSYTVPTVTNSSLTLSDVNTSMTIGRLAFTNSNGLTLSLSTTTGGSATLLGSYTEGSNTLGISNLGNTAGTSGVVSGQSVRCLFAGGNNITLSQSVNGVSATITISAFTQSVESQSAGISNLGNTAGTSGIASGGQVQLILAGGNNITLSQSVNGASATVTISAFTQSAESQTIGMHTSTAGGGTGGTSGLVTAAQVSLGFFAGSNITLSQSRTSNSASLTIYGPSAGGSITISAGATSGGFNSVVFSNSNNISFGLNGSTITATAINTGNLYATGNTTGTSSGTYDYRTLSIAGSGGISVAASNSGFVISCAPAVTMSEFQNFDYLIFGTSGIFPVSQSLGLRTLLLCPFMLPSPITFDRINMIGSAQITTTSAGNSFSWSVAVNQSFAFAVTAANTNQNLINIYLFSRGAGVSSTDIVTVGSTQNSINTYQTQIWSYSVTGPNAGNNATINVTNTVSLVVSFPAVTSATFTTLNANTTVTTWQTGYSSWTSTATISTTTGNTLIGSMTISGTWPGTTAWQSNKLLFMNFATSLTNGQYWLGINRDTSTSSNITTAQTNIAAGRTYTSAINASALTLSDQLTYAGGTAAISSSLGILGAGAANSLAPEPGHGSYTATYAGTKTFYNNAGQANGELALSDIRTAFSFFKPWFLLNSNRI